MPNDICVSLFYRAAVQAYKTFSQLYKRAPEVEATTLCLIRSTSRGVLYALLGTNESITMNDLHYTVTKHDTQGRENSTRLCRRLS